MNESRSAIAQALHVMAPDAETVRITPVYTDWSGQPRRRHVVCLLDAGGHAVGDLDAHRAALEILRRELPASVDWSLPHAYVVSTGVLLGDLPADRVAPVTLAEAAEGGAL